MKNNNYVCHMPYLRNSIAYDQDFWYICVKWWYLQTFSSFLIFSFFRLLGVGWRWGGRGKRAKMTQDDKKNSVCWTSYHRNHTSYDLGWWYTCVQRIIYPVFLHFFEILIFRVISGAKEQKMNDKKFCLTPYLRKYTSFNCVFWHTCVKWWYLPQFFSFFQKFDFLGFSKFINEWQKEILRCAPCSSHVCECFRFLLDSLIIAE